MHTAAKTSIKINCSVSELSSRFFIKSISERARDTKEELILLLALQIHWCLKKITGASIQDSHLSSQKHFSLGYSKNILLMFIFI